MGRVPAVASRYQRLAFRSWSTPAVMWAWESNRSSGLVAYLSNPYSLKFNNL